MGCWCFWFVMPAWQSTMAIYGILQQSYIKSVISGGFGSNVKYANPCAFGWITENKPMGKCIRKYWIVQTLVMKCWEKIKPLLKHSQCYGTVTIVVPARQSSFFMSDMKIFHDFISLTGQIYRFDYFLIWCRGSKSMLACKEVSGGFEIRWTCGVLMRKINDVWHVLMSTPHFATSCAVIIQFQLYISRRSCQIYKFGRPNLCFNIGIFKKWLKHIRR